MDITNVNPERLTEEQLTAERTRLEKLLAVGQMDVRTSRRLVAVREAMQKIEALKHPQPETE
jgi:hypothetical protein